MNSLLASFWGLICILAVVSDSSGSTSLSAPPPVYAYAEVKKAIPSVPRNKVEKRSAPKKAVSSPPLSRRQSAILSYSAIPLTQEISSPNNYGPGTTYYHPLQAQASTSYPQYTAPPQYSAPPPPVPQHVPQTQSHTYAVPNQAYHSQPITYNLPSLTFYPPKIIVSKTGVTYYTEPVQSYSSPYQGDGMAASGSFVMPSYAAPPQNFHHPQPANIMQYHPV